MKYILLVFSVCLLLTGAVSVSFATSVSAVAQTIITPGNVSAGVVSIALTGSNCSSSQCGFTPSATTTVGTASPTMSSGSFGAGTYALKTSGADHVGTACTSNSTLSINSSSGVLTNTSSTPGGALAGVCITATPASGSALTQAFTVYSGWFVTTSGSGSACTYGSPCVTLAACQTTMQGSTTDKTCFARAGTYSPPGSLASGCGSTLLVDAETSSGDVGTTYSYYPPDGYNTAIFDGGVTGGFSQATSPPSGSVGSAFCIGEANMTINGLQMQNFFYEDIRAFANGLTVENSILHDSHWYNTSQGAVIGLINVETTGQNTLIANNVLYNAPQKGTDFLGNNTANAFNGSVIKNNLFWNTCAAPTMSDCGAIYQQDNGTNHSTSVTWSNNYVSDTDVPDNNAANSGRALYLDDCTSNLTITGNIVTGIGNYRAQVHSGGSNTFQYNVFDISSGSSNSIIYWGSSGGCSASVTNVATNNVIVGKLNSGSGSAYPSYTSNFSTLANNAYHNYGTSGNLSSTGDTNAVNEDPSLSCWAVTGGSGAAGSPVSFPGIPSSAIPGGWGPPTSSAWSGVYNFFQTGQPGAGGTAPSWSPSGC